MTRIEIAFEKGGVFVAELLEKEAPKTCEALLSILPMEIYFKHSSCAGQALICFPTIDLVPEHQRTVGLYPGTLGFLVKKPEWSIPDELYISYGPYFIPRGFRIDYQEPINVFGQIKENLQELAEVGARISDFGREKVTIKLLK